MESEQEAGEPVVRDPLPPSWWRLGGKETATFLHKFLFGTKLTD